MQNDYFGWMSPVVPGAETETGDAENRSTMRLSPPSPVSPAIPNDERHKDAAVSETRPPEEADLLHALEHSCEGLPVTPSEVRAAMSEDDVRDWRDGKITHANLTAFARWWVANRVWAKRHPAFTEGKS